MPRCTYETPAPHGAGVSDLPNASPGHPTARWEEEQEAARSDEDDTPGEEQVDRPPAEGAGARHDLHRRHPLLDVRYRVRTRSGSWWSCEGLVRRSDR